MFFQEGYFLLLEILFCFKLNFWFLSHNSKDKACYKHQKTGVKDVKYSVICKTAPKNYSFLSGNITPVEQHQITTLHVLDTEAEDRIICFLEDKTSLTIFLLIMFFFFTLEHLMFYTSVP